MYAAFASPSLLAMVADGKVTRRKSKEVKIIGMEGYAKMMGAMTKFAETDLFDSGSRH